MQSVSHDADVPERFLRQGVQACQTLALCMSTVNKHTAYLLAFNTLQLDGTHSETSLLRHCEYVHHQVERDHRFVKRRVNPGLGS
jgi:transposase, IS6 family